MQAPVHRASFRGAKPGANRLPGTAAATALEGATVPSRGAQPLELVMDNKEQIRARFTRHKWGLKLGEAGKDHLKARRRIVASPLLQGDLGGEHEGYTGTSLKGGPGQPSLGAGWAG